MTAAQLPALLIGTILAGLVCLNALLVAVRGFKRKPAYARRRAKYCRRCGCLLAAVLALTMGCEALNVPRDALDPAPPVSESVYVYDVPQRPDDARSGTETQRDELDDGSPFFQMRKALGLP